jgi:hypothetical protein
MKRTVGLDWAGQDWTPLQAVNWTFPPPRYDGFVLISLGPEQSTHGILTRGDAGDTAFLATTGGAAEDAYHYLGLRAAYLGSRDANENGLLDFDFRARTQQKEGKNEGWVLPDGTKTGGPLLLSYGG